MGRKTEAEILIDDVTGVHSKRMNALLITMDDNEFAVNYHKLLEYTLPKLQRSEIVEEAKEQVITIEHVYRSEDEDKK
jgi:hypothetical protein